MGKASFVSGAAAMSGWQDDVLSGKPPVLYSVGTGDLSRIQVGPGIVTLIGGAPGSGKTAFAMQLLVDALRMTPTLWAVVVNVEMPPAALLDRQFSRLSGIDLTVVRHRQFTAEHGGRLETGIATMEPILDRLAFVRAPFDLANVAATVDAVDADVLLIDYLQRVPPPGEHGDRRNAIDQAMAYLRRFADAGVAVVCVAAVSRSRDSKGRSTYSEGLGLASFRESSELEYGCDDAFILLPDPGDRTTVVLHHAKSRHGEIRDIVMRFDGKVQRFVPNKAPQKGRSGSLAAVADLWQRSHVAPDDESEEDA